MNFAKKTSAKIFIIAGLFAATVQPTNADCTLASGKHSNGGCQTSKDGSGNAVYTCIQGNFWWDADCNVAASQIVTGS